MLRLNLRRGVAHADVIGANTLRQKTKVDRLSGVTDHLKLALPLADALDPMLAALVCQALHRALQIATTGPKPDRGT